MTEFMTFLYNYTLERGMMAYINQEEYRSARRQMSALSGALYTALPEAERGLWEDYLNAACEVGRMETEAIFTAAVSLGKELR